MIADEAIARARAVLAEGAGVATALPVIRLDGQPPYWLVTIDDREHTLAVAAIGEDGEVIGAGRPSSPGRHVTIDAARAREIAGVPATAATAASRLVWFASRASASPLFPLWEVTRAGAPVWVAMDGTLFTERPGDGGPG